MTCLAVSEGILKLFSQLALKFEYRCVLASSTSSTLEITFKLSYLLYIHHAQTSLLVDCAGGTQGVQLLDRSNKGQVQAVRFRRVWVTWHPSI